MKNWKKVGTPVALAAILLTGYAAYSQADGATQPGNVDDPLITKSYVDQQLQQLVQKEVAKQIPSTPPTSPGTGSGLTTTVVELKAGQTLTLNAGSELIVRNGKTLTVSSDDNGIPDVTAGIDVAPNAPVQINHLLMFPREGRGIKPDPRVKQDIIFVMVREALS
ncbi:hypothetical protein N6H14_10935 [Paenibacillus sp. CC-CFT747]|nr:hypothetical protein N6H14_10935 [Paenibacillus sp. CC-CFT747]